jgi:DNA-binding NarL/FixJ family response regulator
MEHPQSSSSPGLLLSDDLIFSSRITAVARDLSLEVRVAKSADALLSLARQRPPACAILDLSNPGLKIGECVAALKSLAPRPRIIAYGSHVDTATLRAARDAGCDLVMPRSQFVAELPVALATWMKQ